MKESQAIITLTLLLSIGFALSLQLGEEPVHGWKPGYWSWFTSSLVTYSSNWYHEGPTALGFGMFEYPDSIEFNKLKDRRHYNSYPPGYAVPVYLVSKLLGTPPNHDIVIGVSKINLFFTGLFLSLTAYILYRRHIENRILTSLYSAIPGLTAYFTPSIRNIFSTHVSPDIAVILPFTIVVFLEILRDNTRINPKLTDALLAAALFFGTLTEWLILFTAAGITVKRFFTWQTRPWKKTFLKDLEKIWAPIIIALILWLSISAYHGNMKRITRRYEDSGLTTERALSFSENAGLAVKKLFNLYGGWPILKVVKYAGILYALLLAGYGYSVRYKGKKRSQDFEKLFHYTYLLSIPILIHTTLFIRHALKPTHPFPFAKLILPFNLIILVFLPLSLLITAGRIRFKTEDKDSEKIINALTLFLLASMVVCCTLLFWTLKDEYTVRDEVMSTNIDEANFIRENTGYNDFLVSNQYWISEFPPQAISHSRKPVHRLPENSSFRQACIKTHGINGDYTLNIVARNSMGPGGLDVKGNFRENEYNILSSTQLDLNIYRIEGDKFRKYCINTYGGEKTDLSAWSHRLKQLKSKTETQYYYDEEDLVDDLEKLVDEIKKNIEPPEDD